MPDADLETHTLDVPGARLYYERRGTGPLLLMIGSPMEAVPEAVGWREGRGSGAGLRA